MAHLWKYAGIAAALILATGCHRAPWSHGEVPPQLLGTPSGDTSPPVAAGKYDNFQEIFADVAEAALPAVVSVHSEKQVASDESSPSLNGSPFEYFFGAPGSGTHEEAGLGSGVLIDSSGIILTNNHVIEGADRIEVQLHDDREFDADVVGADKPSDLAVIRIRGGHGPFPFLRLGDSDKLRIGEWVLAVGSPYGLSQTVTTGIISAKGRHNTGINSYENFLQTDAAINPGNSGGALLNLRGELIGINTAIFSESGGYQGIGFAIPINMARKISADLIRDGAVTRGWLGVSVQPLDPDLAQALGVKDRKGALVGGVVPGSPADHTGIKRGDVIERVDRTPIEDPNDLLNQIALDAPGSWAHVVVNRDGKELSFQVKIGRRDESHLASYQKLEQQDASETEALGLKVEDLSPQLRSDYRIDAGVTHGAVITSVDPGGRAARARLREGDVIQEVNRRRVMTAEDFRREFRKSRNGNRILLLVNRRGSTFFCAL